MYRLRDLKNGLFQIHSKRHNPAYEGTPRSVFATASKMGVPEQELATAVNQLQYTGHDYADFDDNGRFMYTKPGKPK